MRKSSSLHFLHSSLITTTLALGLLGGCTDSMDVVDDTEKRRDMSLPPPHDLAIPDLSAASDMATRGDMATTSRDMAMGGTDMAMGGRDMAMGSVDMASAVDLATTDGAHTFTCRGLDAPGTVYQLVTNSLTLPTGTGATAFTYDFDGSGRLKNGLKTLVSTVKLAGLDLQTPIDTAVKSGATLQLASLTTTNLMTASCAGMTVIPAKPALMPPLFDGTDVLEHFPTTPADLIASLSAGKLQTKASKSLAATEDAILDLQLSIGAMALVVPVHGLHMEGTVERIGTVTRIKSGILHGVIAATDVDAKLIPGIAATVTNMINGDPMSATTRLIISLLENMANPVTLAKCMMPTMCCKTNPTTCVILPAEVKMSLIGSVLAPDVQVFDTMGKWSPAPAGTSPNGLSVGIGFSAVTATYR